MVRGDRCARVGAGEGKEGEGKRSTKLRDSLRTGDGIIVALNVLSLEVNISNVIRGLRRCP